MVIKKKKCCTAPKSCCCIGDCTMNKVKKKKEVYVHFKIELEPMR